MLARNVLLRTRGFSPCQHEFGREPELAFGLLVSGADVAAVTMPVLGPPPHIGRVASSGTASPSEKSSTTENLFYGLLCGTFPWPWQQLSLNVWWVSSVDYNAVQVTKMAQLHILYLKTVRSLVLL